VCGQWRGLDWWSKDQIGKKGGVLENDEGKTRPEAVFTGEKKKKKNPRQPIENPPKTSTWNPKRLGRINKKDKIGGGVPKRGEK